MHVEQDAERRRLDAARTEGVPWRMWGPYLADRQWGTVREDYSEFGTAWEYFPHDQARFRAYRWNEDGLLGISDDRGFVCFALALWNERDSILKERLFGLTGNEGNHGEDVKECYYYLDCTPTHSYMEALYRYPQCEFPYEQLLEENDKRGREGAEYELIDTGVFDEQRYFDVRVIYAKFSTDDIVAQIEVTNHGPEAAPIHVLPTLWFRNTWSWGRDARKPSLIPEGDGVVHARHPRAGNLWLSVETRTELLFTENESDLNRLWGLPNAGRVKDGIHRALVNGDQSAVSRTEGGTKVAAHQRRVVQPGATEIFRARISAERPREPFAEVQELVDRRKAEADEFYDGLRAGLSEDEARVQRQAFAGLLWSKQYYNYDLADWLDGDPAQPTPSDFRKNGRNKDWVHFDASDVLSMPDKWEYPWFAAWDLAFHCIPMALVDIEFSKSQLLLMGREWYQHPNGQLPAYEWAFGDVNPPVHAWATWRVYKIEHRIHGRTDRPFLEEMFHKLLLNFTWWVNRKDPDGHNVFQGGFLGLDNIGVFDRSAPLPVAGQLAQSDGTAWMGMYCLNMMIIALELALENPVYEGLATKFFEHFLYVAAAMNNLSGDGVALWNEEDEFFYDVLHLATGEMRPLKLRSLVGLIPLLAVETIEPELLDRFPLFRSRLEWFLEHRPDLASLVSRWYEPGLGERRLLGLVRGHRMKRLLWRMLDTSEFLSDYGVRSMSRAHADPPYVVRVGETEYTVKYEPAESTTGLFGGNSNWRGPIWFPINYLFIECLQKYHHYYGEDFTVECPSGSGQMLTLDQVANELSRRLESIFLIDSSGRRPTFGDVDRFRDDPAWRDNLLFYEYFDGDSGRGVGAGHQGWTTLVAKLLEQTGARRAGGRLRNDIVPTGPLLSRSIQPPATS